MTMLAVRPKECFTTMGRETFLAKVTWENGWPVVNPGVGLLTDVVEVDLPEWIPEKDPNSYTSRTGHKTCVPGSSRTYEFAKMKELGDEFMTLRGPLNDRMQLVEGEGLKLTFAPDKLTEQGVPSFVCIRQQHHRFNVSASVKTVGISENGVAGLVLLQNNLYHLKVELSAGRASLILCENGADKVLGTMEVKDEEITVGLVIEDLNATGFVEDGNGRRQFETVADVRNLSTEVAGGFVGCTAGIYAVGEGSSVCFTRLSYQA